MQQKTSPGPKKDFRGQKRKKNNSTPGASNHRNTPKSKKNNKKESTLDNRIFTKKAEVQIQHTYTAKNTIEQLPVNPSIIKNLLTKGYKTPTEIQEKSLQGLLEGRNLLGLAQTGTGKTAAFLVPLVHQLINTPAAFQVLIVIPTRELALQIEDELRSITKGLNIYSQVFIGGTNVGKDIQKLKRASHFIIGTPGRLHDMANKGMLKFNLFNTFVLDEFDRLLDMGFSEDIKRMVQAMSQRKQTILFSATEEAGQKKLINELLENPVEVRINRNNSTGDHIDQESISVKNGENKIDVLTALLNQPDFEKVIVFAETKRWVSKVCKELKQRGISTDEIHGDKSQNYRQKALSNFKTSKIQVLVATDVAARGIDVDEVSHVINYQKPKNLDSYIHRIGRTGRAGKSGKAYTFIN